jgi:TetR/AcrR family transcriptional regulator
MSPRGKDQNERMRSEAMSRISQASLKVFAEYGFHGATMKQISKASGLSYGLVYHYFSSKGKVFLCLLDYALESPLIALNAALNGPQGAWEKIETLSGLLAPDIFASESSFYFFFVIQAMTLKNSIPGVAEKFEAKLGEYYEKLVPVIRQAQKSGEAVKGDPTALAATYFSLVQGLALLVFQGKGLEKKITPQMLSNVLSSGR